MIHNYYSNTQTNERLNEQTHVGSFMFCFNGVTSKGYTNTILTHKLRND